MEHRRLKEENVISRRPRHWPLLLTITLRRNEGGLKAQEAEERQDISGEVHSHHDQGSAYLFSPTSGKAKRLNHEKRTESGD